MKALAVALLSACTAWSAEATQPVTPSVPTGVVTAARSVVTALDHCSTQGDRSLFGVFECWRAKTLFTPRLRIFFEKEETWQYPEFLATMKDASLLDWSSSAQVEIRERPSTSASGTRVFSVKLQQINLTLECNSKASNCLLDGFEWPFTFAELYCTSPLPVMKDFHVAILRNPALARVAEQVFEQPDSPHDGEPARTPVVRRRDLINHRAHYIAADFDLEVELPEILQEAKPVEGQLKSFAVYGDAVPLECQWRD